MLPLYCQLERVRQFKSKKKSSIHSCEYMNSIKNDFNHRTKGENIVSSSGFRLVNQPGLRFFREQSKVLRN